MIRKTVKPKSILSIFLLVIILMVAVVSPIQARDIVDIQKEIEENQKELKDLQSQLAAKEKQLSSAANQRKNSQSELERVKAEVEEKKIEIEVVEMELKELETIYNAQVLEKEKAEERQTQQLNSLYMSWKNNDDISSILLPTNDDPLKNKYYMEIVSETDQEGLNDTYKKIKELEEEIGSVEDKKAELDKKKSELESKQKELEQTIATLQRQESSYASGIRQIKPKINETQAELEFLSQEQKAMQDLEESLIGGGNNTGTHELISGEYYFFGRGRDLYQGHGVGMSQWGAFGAANSGWSADQILKHYYSGVSITTATGKVNVNGPTHYKSNLDIEAYVAGAGEVPNKACGTAAQAASRPDKYVVDNPNSLWDCWPEEAIKAQMIAYRTYGLRTVNVYDDARSQVYTGTTSKQWAADETKGKVIKYNGSLISAVYSSDNNQGWGTADNDTVWSNYEGVGTPYAYLRAKKDVDFAYRTSWSKWTYRTNSYDINQLNRMLVFSSTSSSVSSGARSYASSVRSAVGTLTALSFERDASGRVKKVKLTGTKGSKYMAGWLYKSLWNVWVSTEKPSGQVDYIYSLTFYFAKV